MTNNVIDIFTKNPIDKRFKRSNLVRTVLDRMGDVVEDVAHRSVVVIVIDNDGEHLTDYFVQPEDFAKMCVILGNLSDEMSDRSMGIEDLD